jgi:glycine dehydrogenase
MIGIYQEFEAIEQGKIDPQDNPLKNAPHTVESLCESWQHPYSRTEAVYPTAWTKERKFWVSVGRIDNAFGDRNLICSCEGMQAYQED